jgi:hypothetical protein
VKLFFRRFPRSRQRVGFGQTSWVTSRMIKSSEMFRDPGSEWVSANSIVHISDTSRIKNKYRDVVKSRQGLVLCNLARIILIFTRLIEKTVKGGGGGIEKRGGVYIP